MSKDRQRSTVHVVRFVNGWGTVFYAALPWGPASSKTPIGCGPKATELKHRLVTKLLDHHRATESLLRKCRHPANGVSLPIQIEYGTLGRPRLQLGAYRGPAISFCKGGGKFWAALCGTASDIGIDVAEIDEFQGAYPVRRVFHAQELHHALSLTDEDLISASALLWSVKEAVVKTLGCGFHLVDPRQIRVYPSLQGTTRKADGYSFRVGLSGKARMRFPLGAGRDLWVRSYPQVKMWLSIALFNGQHRCVDRWRRCIDASTLLRQNVAP